MSQPIDLDVAREKLSACKDAPDYAAWAAYRGANLLAELADARAEIAALRAENERLKNESRYTAPRFY